MRANELREMTIDELKLKIDDLLEELFNLRFQKAMNRVENPMKIREVKREIARARTIVREAELKAKQKK